MNDNIHTPDDGRGRRKVFVDGRHIDKVFYADTDSGIVHCYNEPLKMDESTGNLSWREVKGVVTVVPL